MRIAERAGVETFLAGKKGLRRRLMIGYRSAGSSEAFVKRSVWRAAGHGFHEVDGSPTGRDRHRTGHRQPKSRLSARVCGRFEPALNLLQFRRVNVTDMISETLPLSQARRAFALAAKRGC